MALLANYHTHTTLCDGRDTPGEMAEQALRLGLRHLGFSGHMDKDVHMDMALYRREIRALQAKYKGKMEILLGIELDTLYPPEAAEGLDYHIGSTHFLDLPPIDGVACSVDLSAEHIRNVAEQYFSGDFYALSKAYYALEATVVDRLHPSFLGHFDLVVCFNGLPKEQGGQFLDETSSAYRRPALEALEYLASKGIPFEINTSAVVRGRRTEPYPSLFLLQALRSFGGEILISSDAHQKERLNAGFPLAIRAALAAGFTHTNILTRGNGGAVCWKQLALDTL